MKRIAAGAAMVLGLFLATALAAAPAKLTPANKQSGFKKGLSVRYAYAGPPPARIQTISEAKSMLKSAKPGKPLRGLDYRDTKDGQPVLTFKEAYNVAADIRGYIKFDAPGVYQIEVWSNDGVDARISGQRVGHFSGRQSCQGNVIMEVDVPKAGWYPLQMAYFQKYSTSCLMMRWAKKGQKLSWVPNSAFGH
ncbi:MAG: PA14 domain-containing protein [Paracoccaceae bacterium]